MQNIKFIESVKQMPLVKLPVRSTLISIGNRSVLISPGSALTVEELKSLGKVTDIIAPNLIHSAGIPKAHQVFPDAKIWGPPGAKVAKPNIPWTHEITSANWPFQNEMPIVMIEGSPQLNEIVFFHRESKTLIVTDLVFNLVDARGLGAWIIFNIFGTYQRFAVSKLLLKKYTKDKETLKKSVKEVLSFDFKSIVMGHGREVTSNAKEKLQAALQERDLL